ncbi:MAG: hypothetical protein L6R00_01400 [Phycisphaerae bacterium]|nr:hypothetical protein [Phycisphaerae bacterium]
MMPFGSGSTRARTFLRPCIAALWVALGGCVATPHELRTEPSFAAEELASLNDSAFAPRAAILDGFDAATNFDAWRVGDQVLFGVRLDDNARRHTWFIRVELKTGLVTRGTKVTVMKAGELPPADAGSDAGLFVSLSPADGTSDAGRTFTAPAWSFEFAATDADGRRRSVNRSNESIFVAIHVYDEHGRLIETAHAFLPEADLRGGLHRACRMATASQPAAGAPLSDEQFAAMVDAFAAMYAFTGVMTRTRNLEPIVWSVLPLPSIFSIILSGGRVQLGFDAGFEKAIVETRRFPGAGRGQSVYRVPVTMSINRIAAAACQMVLAPPDPPLHLCAGVVAVEGSRIDDPARRFLIQLLAARRGGQSK